MPEQLTLLPCPNPYCFADKHPRIASTGVDCMTQCNHTVQCSCGITVAGMSIEEAVDTWNALPRALEWTDIRPKVPGWYWFKGEYGIRIAWIKHDSRKMNELYAVIGGVGNWMSTLHGQWAGPIPEPREQKE